MFCTFTLALCEICVQCPILLCSVVQYFVSYRYVTRVFSEWFWDGTICSYCTWYHVCFYIIYTLYFRVRSVYSRICSATFLTTYLSPDVTDVYWPKCSFLSSRIVMSGLWLVLSVCIFWFHNMVTLPSWLVSIDFGTRSYQCSLSNLIPSSLHMLKRSWAQALSDLFMCCCFANIGHAGIMWFIIIIIIIIRTLFRLPRWRRRLDRPWRPLNPVYIGFRISFSGKSGRGVALTFHPLPEPERSKEWSSLCAFMTCYRVKYILTFIFCSSIFTD